MSIYLFVFRQRFILAINHIREKHARCHRRHRHCIAHLRNGRGCGKDERKRAHGTAPEGKELILGGPGKGMPAVSCSLPMAPARAQSSSKAATLSRSKAFYRTWKDGRDAGKETCETWVKSGPKSVEVLVG
jgi:hypothetical protein